MCAYRCGIKVHLAIFAASKVIKTTQSTKGYYVARVQLDYAALLPAQLTKPLRRVGERSAGHFEEIEWDDALE